MPGGRPVGARGARCGRGAGGAGRFGRHFHGGADARTAAWTAGYQRRSLLFKYSPGQQSWSANYTRPPEGVELTRRQELLFEQPYFNSRRSLCDGERG